jgi:hypothetical protein
MVGKMKRLLLSVLVLAGIFGAAHAVNISGTNSTNEYSVVKVGYVRNSVTDTITAFASGGQASATLLDSGYNRVSTVATAADSVKLPSCVAGASNTGPLPAGAVSGNTTGLLLWVTNAAAANSMNVYPQIGQSINALSANAAYAVAANKTVAFLCSPGGTIWYSVLGS